MKFAETIAAVILGLATVANGHMEMAYPPPFRSKFNPNSGSDIDYSMTSPLSASGADYPCKGYQKLLGTPEGKSVVTWAPGGSYNLTITGSANHGGGSCQASLSYDKGQTWKVIHSYIGGCPPQEDSNWNFNVPSDAPSGDALFAWTWFNNIGNREMYMNCAAITIGSGKKRSASTPFASRPNTFVANVGNNVCTFEGKDVEFPQPGPDVDNKSQGTAPPGQGTCSGAAPAAPPAGDPAASQAPASQAPATQPQATQPAATSAPAPKAPATSIPGGVFITSPAAKPTTLVSVTSISQPAATSTQQQQQPSPPPTPATSSPASPPTAPQPTPSVGGGGSSPSNGSAPSSTAAGSSCSEEGQWNCASDGKSFQRCASGAWSASIPVAAGTSCQPGASDSLTMVNKRSGSGFIRRRRFVSERFQQERTLS